MKITAKSTICMIIGDPVNHSLSPLMHNTAYESVNLEEKFVYIAARVTKNDIADCIKGIRAMGIRGVSCTSPHKQSVIEHLDKIDPVAKEIGAVNTIVNNNGVLTGYNTDWLGIVTPVNKILSPGKKHAVILGAGGAARAAAYALKSLNMQLTIYNRTKSTGQILADDFKAAVGNMDKLLELKNADIIINTIPAHTSNVISKQILTEDIISKNQIIFDINYKDAENSLLNQAKQKSAQTISGADMLLYQGIEQFRLFTGVNAPEQVMREVIERNL